jgi:signal transduction histidine kinase
MTAFFSGLTAIVELLKMLRDLFSLWQKARAEGWMEDVVVVLDRVKEAKTDEERKRLARELARLGSFPRS